MLSIVISTEQPVSWVVLLLGMFFGLATSMAFGQESSGTIFYAEDIKASMAEHVANIIDDEGLLHLVDDKTGEALRLRFIQVHNPVRQMKDDIYFACTDFHVEGDAEKIYDIDFWLNGKSGTLTVFQTKVHKEPRHSLLYGWYKHPRYTFVDDEIEYLY